MSSKSKTYQLILLAIMLSSVIAVPLMIFGGGATNSLYAPESEPQPQPQPSNEGEVKSFSSTADGSAGVVDELQGVFLLRGVTDSFNKRELDDAVSSVEGVESIESALSNEGGVIFYTARVNVSSESDAVSVLNEALSELDSLLSSVAVNRFASVSFEVQEFLVAGSEELEEFELGSLTALVSLNASAGDSLVFDCVFEAGNDGVASNSFCQERV